MTLTRSLAEQTTPGAAALFEEARRRRRRRRLVSALVVVALVVGYVVSRGLDGSGPPPNPVGSGGAQRPPASPGSSTHTATGGRLSPIDTGPPLGSIGAVGPDAMWTLDGDGLFVSDLTGTPATDLAPPQSGDALADVFSTDFLSADEGWVVASGNVRIAVDRTVDGGAAWQSTWLPMSLFPQGYDAASVSFATPLDGFVTVEGYVGGTVVFASTDGGATWSAVGHDAPVVEVRFDTAELGWGLSPDGTTLYRTDDGGATWGTVDLRAPTNDPGVSPGTWRSLSLPVFHGSRGVLLAVAERGKAVVETTGDDGDTWLARSAPFAGERAPGNGVSAPPFAVVGAGHWIYWDGGKLSTTTDGGQSWRSFRPVIESATKGLSIVAVGGPGVDNDPLVFSSAPTGWALATTTDGSVSTTTLLLTQDGGRHFRPIAAPT